MLFDFDSMLIEAFHGRSICLQSQVSDAATPLLADVLLTRPEQIYQALRSKCNIIS